MYSSNQQKIILAVLVFLIIIGVGYFYYSANQNSEEKYLSDLKMENPFKFPTKNVDDVPKKEVVYQNTLYSFTYFDDLKISEWKDGDFTSLNLKSSDYKESEVGEVTQGFKIEIFTISKNIYKTDYLDFLDADKKDFGEQVYLEPNYNYEGKVFYKKVLKGKGVKNEYDNNNSFMIIGLYNKESEVVGQIIMTTKSEDDLIYEKIHHDLVKSFDWAKIGNIL